jgi:hypothetical protein
MPNGTHRIGNGPWTVVLWRDLQPAILSGLDRYPLVGDRFEVGGVRRVQVHPERTMGKKKPLRRVAISS